MLPSQLIEEVRALCEEGLTASLSEADGVANVLIINYPVRSRYNKATIELLLRFPLSYTNGKPDMFWTDEDFVLKSGGTPKSADQFETYLGKRRRRFSWHLSSWNPGVDNLVTFLEFVENRLAKKE